MFGKLSETVRNKHLKGINHSRSVKLIWGWPLAIIIILINEVMNTCWLNSMTQINMVIRCT